MKLAPLVIGPGVRVHSDLPNTLKFLCRRTGRVVSLCGRSLGCTASGVSGDLIFLGTLLLQGRSQSEQKLVVVGALLVPIASRLVVCVQVYHIVDEGARVEGCGILHPITALALDVYEEIPGCLSQLVEGYW